MGYQRKRSVKLAEHMAAWPAISTEGEGMRIFESYAFLAGPVAGRRTLPRVIERINSRYVGGLIRYSF